MSDGLSQAEIDAMLAGNMPAGDDAENEDILNSLVEGVNDAADHAEQAAEAAEAAEVTEATEADASTEPGFDAPTVVLPDDNTVEYNVSDYLNEVEVDLLGEIGNICMGSVATTMYTLLDRRTNITTPKVEIFAISDVIKAYRVPFIMVDVEYVKGIAGKNLLMLKESDAMLITDILMGGEGVVDAETELTELHMSAINEIMNQMIASSATALSKILGEVVDISPPNATYVGLDSDVGQFLTDIEMVIKISFDMEIEGLLKSQLLQIMPYKVGLDLAEKFMEAERLAAEAAAASTPPPPPAPAAPSAAPAPAAAPSAAPAPAPAPAAAAAAPPPRATAPPVDVHPANYASFDVAANQLYPDDGGLGLVSDIPLQVSVELGKTQKTISEILEFGIGTIVVLDKIAGEHVDIMVNGKLIASGEVVVIDENYGVRITDLYE